MKKDQADVAIAFQESKEMRGPKLIPEHILNWRESQRLEIQRLNTRSWIGSEEKNRTSTLPRNHKTNADFAEEVLRDSEKPMSAEAIMAGIREKGRGVASKASVQAMLYGNRKRFKTVSHGLWVAS